MFCNKSAHFVVFKNKRLYTNRMYGHNFSSDNSYIHYKYINTIFTDYCFKERKEIFMNEKQRLESQQIIIQLMIQQNKKRIIANTFKLYILHHL